jgi:hypothetical protein
MKLWLDDARPAPDGWVHYQDATTLIADLADENRWYLISHMSLDHDLGAEATGMDVVNAIESWILESGRQAPFTVTVHSQNPVGRARMLQAIERLCLGDPDVIYTVQGVLRTHPKGKCHSEVCAVHNPSDHHMRRWPMLWRHDRGLLERLCEHGVGHPDPDHVTYVREKFGEVEAKYESVHGCDGCCGRPHD